MNQEINRLDRYDARLVLNKASDLFKTGLRLSGKVYDDTLMGGSHPFPDGTEVSTSPLEYIWNRIFVTRSGTRYRIEFADEAE